MSTLTRLSVAFAVLGVLLLTFGTTGFSAVSADRGVDVSVVDDGEAYVGIEIVGDEEYDEDRVKLLTVTNQFASDIESLQVSVVDGSDAIEADSVKPEDSSVGIGEDTDVTAKCTMDQSEGSVDLQITGEAGGASFDITRTVDVDCGPAAGTETVELRDVNTTGNGTGNLTVRFAGNGNVFVQGDAGTYNVTISYEKGNSGVRETSEDITLPEDGEKPLRKGGGRIISVTIGDETVSNPHWNA